MDKVISLIARSGRNVSDRVAEIDFCFNINCCHSYGMKPKGNHWSTSCHLLVIRGFLHFKGNLVSCKRTQSIITELVLLKYQNLLCGLNVSSTNFPDDCIEYFSLLQMYL